MQVVGLWASLVWLVELEVLSCQLQVPICLMAGLECRSALQLLEAPRKDRRPSLPPLVPRQSQQVFNRCLPCRCRYWGSDARDVSSSFVVACGTASPFNTGFSLLHNGGVPARPLAITAAFRKGELLQNSMIVGQAVPVRWDFVVCASQSDRPGQLQMCEVVCLGEASRDDGGDCAW